MWYLHIKITYNMILLVFPMSLKCGNLKTARSDLHILLGGICALTVVVFFRFKKLAATLAWRYAASNGSALTANDMERNGDARFQDSEPPTPHSVVKIGLRGASLYFSMKRLFINITMDIVTTSCGLSFIILYWVIAVSFSPPRTLIFVYGQCDIELIRLEL
ncbi:hypothetical protein SO802_014084 [Lithocarpus litseifolius]|uniref:Uncharacterized protein n=1 Tax=Lithocarpus litseifolius TaxID=425828 RepID=A0AAW2D9Y8_9ROSI